MGADGGSIPDRRDLVKTKGKAEQTDKALRRERFFLCALSKKPLTKPVVADPLGKLYNKDAVLEYLLDKSAYGDGEEICRYIKGVKVGKLCGRDRANPQDLLTLNVMPNPNRDEDADATSASRAPFVCWLSLKEMTGAVPFIAIRSCGCVFSEAAIRAVVPNLGAGGSKDEGADSAAPCPNCTKPFNPTSRTAVLPINPNPDVQDALLEALLAGRAAAKANKKRKAASSEVKKEGKDGKEVSSKAARTGSDSPAPGSKPNSKGVAKPSASVAPSTVGRSVQDKLAEQEKKRIAAQAGMSDAVKAMFRSKNGDAKEDAVDSFFGRTFNRVSHLERYLAR